VGAARGDLWFDELWSLVRAELVERPLDVLAKRELQHDNNHWLTTLAFHWIGPGATPLVYRAQSWLASVLGLALLGRIAWRRSSTAGLFALALAAPSFLLVLYGSEARGYSGAVLASLLAFALVERDEAWCRSARAPLLWCTALFGIASHLTFLYGYAALIAWHAVTAWRAPARGAALRRFAAFHALPCLGIAMLAVTTLRHIVIGGGPRFTAPEVALETMGWVFGAPTGSRWSLVALAATALVVVVESALRWRERDPSALHLPLLLLTPGILICVREPEVLYPRYFLVCVPFFLLAFASLLARAWRGSSALRLGALAVLGVVSATNLAADQRLLEVGRGQYSAALRFLDRETPSGPIAIGVEGDHNRRLLLHHAEALGLARELRLLDSKESEAHPPLWVLGDSQDLAFEPPTALHGSNKARYTLVGKFEYVGLSGQRWFLYRRQPN
jgi:hypothetical protein